MLPLPMDGAIIPDPTEEEFNNLNLTEEDIDNKLLATEAFDSEDEEKIKVRFKK